MPKNYETVSTFGKVMHRKLLASFFPDTVYSLKDRECVCLNEQIQQHL